ncbi:MAG: biotin--[acetyl-CoA-carboxylase] ligase [Fibrella sp.]|nr:biotin--[acetyl-CoA-carboxylase] ligase [Armatimonadota bacterium]
MSTLRFGRETYNMNTLPSTQDAARSLAEHHGSSVAGAIYSTPHQTAGRGRQGRTWFAPPGANVVMTLIGDSVALAELWQVSFVAALAAADAIVSAAPGVPVHLRFPNDVLLSGKKVCGILVETATGPGVPPGTAMPLIGVGINVRGGTDALPPEVAVRATTIQAETGSEIAVAHVGGLLAEAFTTRWNEWREVDGFSSTLAAWHAYHDTNARRTFVLDGTSVLCRVIGVSPDGDATIELPDRTRRTIPVAHVLFGG